MTTANAIRCADARARRKAATPADVAELLAEGKRQRAELERQARDAAALSRVQAYVRRRMDEIEDTARPEARASKLGALADYLSRAEIQDLIKRTKENHAVMRRICRIEVPAWVREEDAPAFRAEYMARGGFAAAKLARRLKAEANV